jgi:hypothetical protein
MASWIRYIIVTSARDLVATAVIDTPILVIAVMRGRSGAGAGLIRLD